MHLGAQHQAAFSEDKSFACMVDQIQDGPLIRVYPSGRIKAVGQMKDGKMTGTWSRYFPNGIKEDQGEWRDGIPEGSWTFFYDNGSIRSRGRMDDGRPVCLWEHWDLAGHLGKVMEKARPTSGSCGDSRFEQHAISLQDDAFAQPKCDVSQSLAGGLNPYHRSSWLASGELATSFISESTGGWSLSPQFAWTPFGFPNHWLPWGLEISERFDLTFFRGSNASTYSVIGYSLALEGELNRALRLQISGGGITALSGGSDPQVGLAFIICPEQWGVSWMDHLLDSIILRAVIVGTSTSPWIQETSIGLRWAWKTR
jgi:hypothetical protein